MLVHWIWLATRPDVNDRTKAALLQHFQDPETAFFADAGSYRLVEGITPEGIEALNDKNLCQAEEILGECDQKNLHILTYQDASYPARLKNISDPPLVFYYKGRLPDFDGTPLIGIVGTRKATPYGMNVAKRMGYQIAKCGGIVVSGMAYGIDGMAMEGALTAGMSAVGILGCGADMVYPQSNKALFEDMEHYGCIMSEFPPGTPPYKWNFPKRNRIISGMSCGVLVVEAPAKSGALITAGLALDQGRDVFAVPGNIDMPTFEGSNRLIQEGAVLAGSGWEVMREYEAQFPDKVHNHMASSGKTICSEELKAAAQTEKTQPKVAQNPRILGKKQPPKQKIDKKVIDKAESTLYSDFNDSAPALTETEQKIASALRGGERLVDDVIAETGLKSSVVLAELTFMELKGLVKRLPGKRVRLN